MMTAWIRLCHTSTKTGVMVFGAIRYTPWFFSSCSHNLVQIDGNIEQSPLNVSEAQACGCTLDSRSAKRFLSAQ